MASTVLVIQASPNAFTHDSSACVVRDGGVLFATEEERSSRNATSRGYLPKEAMKSCLTYSDLSIHDVDSIAVDGAAFPGVAQKIAHNVRHHFG